MGRKQFSLLVGSASFLAYLFLLFYGNKFCLNENFICPTNWYSWKDIIWISSGFLFVIPLHFLPSSYFNNWFRFAVWYIPAAMIIAWWLQAGVLESSSGWMNLYSLLTDSFLILLFFIFIVGSLVQLWRAYHRSAK
jgi:hypothetical protein